MSDSRVITKDFEYFVAKTTDEAVSVLSRYGDRARVVAGGTDLLVGIKTGKVQPDCLINIKTVEGIDRIDESKGSLKIGAGCTFHQLERSSLVKERYEALYEAARAVSSTQIKNMGTIGGNICNASPASDCAPPLLVFEARARIKGLGRDRQIPVEEFFVGPGETSLLRSEILTEIELPFLSSDSGSAFLKIARVSADLAKVNVAIYIRRDGEVCKECRIALGSVAKVPIRTRGAEAMMKGEIYSEELVRGVAQKASEEIFPITDVRSTKEYRKEVAKVIVRETLERAWKRGEGAI